VQTTNLKIVEKMGSNNNSMRQSSGNTLYFWWNFQKRWKFRRASGSAEHHHWRIPL